MSVVSCLPQSVRDGRVRKDRFLGVCVWGGGRTPDVHVQKPGADVPTRCLIWTQVCCVSYLLPRLSAHPVVMLDLLTVGAAVT